jgi:tRNA (cytidine/uridine-2'-O-)-methyltransferase
VRYNEPVHIVLYEPDIPGNTGNVGRSCVATGSRLHLVGKLGFSLDDAHVKRSGLDYWEKVDLVKHQDWEAFLGALPAEAPLYFFSKKAKRDYWSATFAPESYLIFGCETTGLPSPFQKRYENQMYRIPMRPDSVRSLNLSTSVGVVLYEALRQSGAVFNGHIASKTA